MAYWAIVLAEKYCAMGSGVTSELSVENQKKNEDMVVWLKEVDFVFKTGLSECSRDDILSKARRFIFEIDHFMEYVSSKTVDPDLLCPPELFLQIKSPAFTSKAILLQTVVQLFSTGTSESEPSTPPDTGAVVTINQEFLFDTLLSLNEGYYHWPPAEYLSNHFHLFTIHNLLKL
ncbi:unnamed protein product [Ambrosiozyma monospora]|uniref:Unnamed protein product n=1 Tax=Ambrosiozyma monospora TaxID=43982 RepID=A0ACB5TAD8_AMBMO|nr:unnamed protein product [Ambrosiozyma monospora]